MAPRAANLAAELAHPRALAETDLAVAALFVETQGCYSGLAGVDLWDEARDARLYAGPWPVIAHPPCERWGRYWSGGPSYEGPPLLLGDDGGCFLAALEAVQLWGGVLEHPAHSHAWAAFGLARPPKAGGWVKADFFGSTCHVEQGAYGHRARKATWLYACHVPLPDLKWGRASGDFVRLDAGVHSAEERRRAVRTGACQRLSRKQRRATPIPFRDLLLEMVIGRK